MLRQKIRIGAEVRGVHFGHAKRNVRKHQILANQKVRLAFAVSFLNKKKEYESKKKSQITEGYAKKETYLKVI
jgi:hypothetical protein